MIPALRQISATGGPSVPCFKINAFCASENFEAFIGFRSSQPGNLARKTLAKNGPVLRAQIIVVMSSPHRWMSRGAQVSPDRVSWMIGIL